jgi:hypothetical protein
MSMSCRSLALFGSADIYTHTVHKTFCHAFTASTRNKHLDDKQECTELYANICNVLTSSCCPRIVCTRTQYIDTQIAGSCCMQHEVDAQQSSHLLSKAVKKGLEPHLPIDRFMAELVAVQERAIEVGLHAADCGHDFWVVTVHKHAPV